jgi:hypothetical protein
MVVDSSTSLTRYLRKRAVAGPWQISGTDRRDFSAAVVIPVLAEAETLPQTLQSLATSPSEFLDRTLILAVVNNRQDASALQKGSNRQTLAWLETRPYPQLQLAWIDAASPGRELPAGKGVGLARKIGFDQALQRLAGQQAALLISLDADTLVDDNYLPAIEAHFEQSVTGACVLPFRHQTGATAAQEKAIRDYELYLRSYLLGLRLAGSPYAYQTLGSAFACRVTAYVAAGGMNRRRAAEDFYFLQQLAKTTGVERLQGTVVRPSPRCSDRVPFGTGRVVRETLKTATAGYRFVPTVAFRLLRDWLALVDGHPAAPAAQLQQRAEDLSGVLGRFLCELDFVTNWSRLQRNHADPAARGRAFQSWFDGLRTRQLLGRLSREEEAPAAETVAALLAWAGYAGVADPAQQLALLEQLQGVISEEEIIPA